MFSWYKYLIVSLFFWSGNLFLIAPSPDLCLLVPFSSHYTVASDAIIASVVLKSSFINSHFSPDFCLSEYDFYKYSPWVYSFLLISGTISFERGAERKFR